MPVILVLESVAAAPMLVQTRHRVQWKVIGAILLAACVTVPLGVLALVAVDPIIIRRAIAVTVIVFAIVLLRGWRYAGRPRLATSVGLGAISGAMVGATSIGGPPVILYLLSGPDPIETTRANLTLYVAVISLISVVILWQQGVFDARPAGCRCCSRRRTTSAFSLVCGYFHASAIRAFVSSRCCC